MNQAAETKEGKDYWISGRKQSGSKYFILSKDSKEILDMGSPKE